MNRITLLVSLLGLGATACAYDVGEGGDGFATTGELAAITAIDESGGVGMADESTGELAACTGVAAEVPDDPAARGPWEVGVRTLTIGRLTTEIWYPAAPGSEVGKAPVQYDVRDYLPTRARRRISDSEAPFQDCDCYRDLPVDTASGPFPVITFVHGTGAFRTQSLNQMTHWASRGFVVVAADHPGLKLADILAFAFWCFYPWGGSQNLSGDVNAMLTALTNGTSGTGFLQGHIDLSRVGMVGHSAGGNAVAQYATKPGVKAIVPMAASRATTQATPLESVLYLAGNADQVVNYQSSLNAYEGTSGSKRFVGINNTGHLAFSDLCDTRNDDDQNLLEIAQSNGVCGANLAGGLFDCDDSYLPGPMSWEIVNFATTAVFEETLYCSDANPWPAFQSTYPDVAQFEESL